MRQRQFRVWMPWMPMSLMSARSATETRPAFAIFRTLPRMTKHEIKEYLTKIYNLPVTKVNTMNYMGKRKRVISNRGISSFKYSDFKKAVVVFDDTLKDVGIGTMLTDVPDSSSTTSTSPSTTPPSITG